VIEEDDRFSIPLGGARRQKRERAVLVGRRVERGGRPLVEALTCLRDGALEGSHGALSRIDPLGSV
jgi:hypothetical protein